MTSGDPAGIGPDICLALAGERLATRLAVLGDAGTLTARARALGLDVSIETVDDLAATPRHEAGRMTILPVPVATPVTAGKLAPENARSVITMLEIAVRACVTGPVDAIVTAPVQKSVINEAGIAFSGHTELLAELTGAATPVMLLAADTLRVALATTHLPLAGVPEAITRSGLEAALRVVDADLRRLFRIDRPRLLVLGLNPHAGESGVLGREEIETIAPAVAALRAEGLAVSGPVPADSAFTADSLAGCDAVVAMYHDQGLPVLKARSFGETVNVTLGLPIVRTSVDHGTALALAGTGRARHASLRAAVDLAIEIAVRQ